MLNILKPLTTHEDINVIKVQITKDLHPDVVKSIALTLSGCFEFFVLFCFFHNPVNMSSCVVSGPLATRFRTSNETLAENKLISLLMLNNSRFS